MSKAQGAEPQQSTARTAVLATQRFQPFAYRVDDAAALVGVSISKLYDLIREGRLPSRKLDGSTIIRHEDLTAFIDGLPLVRQLAEPSMIPPPVPSPPVPRAAPTPPPPPAPIRPSAPPVDLRREPPQPRLAQSPPPALSTPDKNAPYGRGRTGKPLPPPNPNGWGARTLRRPSEQLAAIVGADSMLRTQVVAKVWAYIREHGLQDPANKQAIIADDKLRAVFGQDRCTMFEMQKLLSPHLTAA